MELNVEKGIALEAWLTRIQTEYSQATGDLTDLLREIAAIGKIIGQAVNQAGITGILGEEGRTNVHGESVQKLDEFANQAFLSRLSNTGHIAAIASEEMEHIYPIPNPNLRGKYVLAIDPLDGSSNIDVNISIGSIFSIHRKISPGNAVSESDFMQPGRDQVAAGYILYGTSTMLVYTAGFGTHGFTLDPDLGAFFLSHESIHTPNKGAYYSINEGNSRGWEDGTRCYVEALKAAGRSARYVGSLVSDFHRNLLKGGIFLYPADRKNKQGKLRLLYEAAPLAFVSEQAGGLASSGMTAIADIKPTSLHERTPLLIGSVEDVRQAEEYNRKASMPDGAAP